MKLRGIFYDILIGLPGGCLILMGMFMFNAVLSILIPTGQWIMLAILCVTSLVVGMLARLMRPFHGLGTAIASGVIAALIILYLWLATRAGTGMGLAIGPVGMLVAVGFSLLGAWIFPHLRKRPRTDKELPNETAHHIL
jgi:hypothetical protein